MSDPALATLMGKVKVSENAELSAQYPEAAPSRLSVRMSSGDVLSAEVKYPKGHAKNPMQDREVEQKFRGLFGQFGNGAQCNDALRALWNLERARDVGPEIIDRFAIRSDDD